MTLSGPFADFPSLKDTILQNFPHAVKWKGGFLSTHPSGEPFSEAVKWCERLIGPSALQTINGHLYWNSDGRWGVANRSFNFRDIDDAFHFKLRWA